MSTLKIVALKTCISEVPDSSLGLHNVILTETFRSSPYSDRTNFRVVPSNKSRPPPSKSSETIIDPNI